MLYNGAVNFVNESISGLNAKDIEKSHNANERVQSIIRELMLTLDMQYELSKNLMSLYEYIEHRLQDAKFKNDIDALEEARTLITELRDTWVQAISK
jgi:flagellar protein FliS